MTNLRSLIAAWLAEDIGDGDHTTQATIPAAATGRARLLVKQNGTLAGINLAKQIFHDYDGDLLISPKANDGDSVETGQVVLTVEGNQRSILTTERLVLNCMQRMSGIATLTRKFVEAVRGTRATILDTRKTTPGFRLPEKEAVRIGGAGNHRFGLFDMILVKDNHIDYAGGISKAISAAKEYLAKHHLDLKIEVEARTLDEVEEIISVGGVMRVLLDNFSPEKMKEAVKLVDRNIQTEASGGITLENVRSYAETGVDFISVGALTHSYQSLDLSLKAY